jgi:hypothetical protein
VQAGVQSIVNNDDFFRNYESANANTDALLKAVGFPGRKAEIETEIWNRIGMVWNWLKANVEDDGVEYTTLLPPGAGPRSLTTLGIMSAMASWFGLRPSPRRTSLPRYWGGWSTRATGSGFRRASHR